MELGLVRIPRELPSRLRKVAMDAATFAARLIAMKQRRHTPEPVIRKLTEGERLLNCRRTGERVTPRAGVEWLVVPRYHDRRLHAQPH